MFEEKGLLIVLYDHGASEQIFGRGMGIAPPKISNVKCNKLTHDSEKNNSTPAKDISLTR